MTRVKKSPSEINLPGRAFTILVFLSLVSSHQSQCAFANTWKEEKGDHFIVFYADDSAKPKETLRKAEQSYEKVASDLGYARHDNFWSWDKRVKIYLHPDKAAFQKATGQPEWSHGMASYFDKEIHSVQGMEHFLEAILPHEITHLIFRDFVGFKGEVPLWMDEGVAQWQEEAKRSESLKVMPEILIAGEAYGVERLMRTDIRRETDGRKVAIFYIQAISLVDFLVKSYGASSFTDFCRGLRDGKSLEQALRSAYPDSMKSLDELETKWVKHVMGKT